MHLIQLLKILINQVKTKYNTLDIIILKKKLPLYKV